MTKSLTKWLFSGRVLLIFSTVFDLKQQFNVINTVLSGEAELALLDGLSLVNEKGIMENSNLEITEFIDDNQYYGIIVSGKAKKIGKCINMYIKTNKVDIQRKLEEQYDHLWKVRENIFCMITMQQYTQLNFSVIRLVKL